MSMDVAMNDDPHLAMAMILAGIERRLEQWAAVEKLRTAQLGHGILVHVSRSLGQIGRQAGVRAARSCRQFGVDPALVLDRIEARG